VWLLYDITILFCIILIKHKYSHNCFNSVLDIGTVTTKMIRNVVV
jgi:hypothetical protein